MTRLSNRQYPMLKVFVERGANGMKIEAAQHFDQRPFRSMLIQGWVAYTPLRGFHVTEAGRRAFKEFHHTDIARKNPAMPLTAYFDPTQYGLGDSKKKSPQSETRRLQVVA